MLKLEILVMPLNSKQVEFSQTLESLKSKLQNLCFNIISDEQDKSFFLSADFQSENKLIEVLQSKELCILSGAMKTLSDKSEITIHLNNSTLKRKWPDLAKARQYYLKKDKENGSSLDSK